MTACVACKNPVRNRLKIQFIEHDFSNLIFQKSSIDQQGDWIAPSEKFLPHYESLEGTRYNYIQTIYTCNVFHIIGWHFQVNQASRDQGKGQITSYCFQFPWHVFSTSVCTKLIALQVCSTICLLIAYSFLWQDYYSQGLRRAIIHFTNIWGKVLFAIFFSRFLNPNYFFQFEFKLF